MFHAQINLQHEFEFFSCAEKGIISYSRISNIPSLKTEYNRVQQNKKTKKNMYWLQITQT